MLHKGIAPVRNAYFDPIISLYVVLRIRIRICNPSTGLWNPGMSTESESTHWVTRDHYRTSGIRMAGTCPPRLPEPNRGTIWSHFFAEIAAEIKLLLFMRSSKPSPSP
jgi:hypothetical protein